MKKIICIIIASLLITGCSENKMSRNIELIEVTSGKINSSNQVNEEKINLIWDRISLIIPKNYLNKIDILEIVNDNNDGNTASVAPNDEFWKTWLYSVNLDGFFEDENLKSDINATILHEFAHILSLEYSQHKKADEKLMNQYTYENIVLSSKSYLDMFYQEFWLSIIDERDELLGGGEYSADKLNNLLSFYTTYQDQFVSDYAAYNPMEDFAECFYMFILNDNPKGVLIKEQKVKFFYNFPELVAMRKCIRENILE